VNSVIFLSICFSFGVGWKLGITKLNTDRFWKSFQWGVWTRFDWLYTIQLSLFAQYKAFISK